LKLDMDYLKKQRLFQNLIIMIKSLHSLGEAHYEICPKNIWVEDQFLVYLRPFKLKQENQNMFNWRKLEKFKSSEASFKFNNNSKYWYMSPEQIIRDRKQPQGYFKQSAGNSSRTQNEGFASDLWSVGCVFAEMFVSLTPVFQAVDTFERTIRFFEVLGIPKKEDAYFMNKELYENVILQINSRNYSDEDFPLIKELARNLSKNEEMILKSLLVFNPHKRPNCDILLEYPFFKGYDNKKTNKFASDDFEKSDGIHELRSVINSSSPTDKSIKTSSPVQEGNYKIYSQRNPKKT